MVICIALMCLMLNLCACAQSESKPSSSKDYGNIQPPKLETFVAETINLEEWEGESTYMITYSAWLDYNNSVGNSWGYGLEYYGEFVESGSYVSCAKVINSIFVTVYAMEYDSVTDYGAAYVSFDSIDVGEKKTKEVAVIVRENRGRYAGNTAQWIFEITVERIS